MLIEFELQLVLAKEIDSKQDLQQEETISLPAEHRSFPDSPHSPGIISPGVGPPGQSMGSDVVTNDPWPLGRPDVSQIKACFYKSLNKYYLK